MTNSTHNRKIVILLALCLIFSLISYFYLKYVFNLTTKRIKIPQTKYSSEVFTDIETNFPRIINQIVTEYRPELAAQFQNAVDNKLPANHSRVVKLVQRMMDKPSSHMIKLSLPLKHTPQSKVMAPYLESKGMLNGGFFIECGALDGERSSNTIYLEQKHGWTGLLIEADPYFYTQLMGKNRRSWSINACLSPSNSIQWLNFKEHSRGQGQLAEEGDTTRKVPCFPFESYMLALGRKNVDFFSLDIEGWETPVIRSINYSKFGIKTWTIEHPTTGDKELVDLMTEPKMGYRVLQKVHDGSAFYARDVLFVKD